MKKLQLFVALLLLSIPLMAQTDTLMQYYQGLPRQVFMSQNQSDVSQVQVGLSIAVLTFGLILALAVLVFLYKMKKGFGNVAFKSLGIILILTASLFLIVAGYGLDQITPVIGLLGTIAGFIFGSTVNADKTTQKIE